MNSTKYWIALEQTHGIGPAHLIELHGLLKEQNLSLVDLCDLTAAEIRNELRLPDKIADAVSGVIQALPKIEDDYLKLLESGIEVVTFFSEAVSARACVRRWGPAYRRYSTSTGPPARSGKKASPSWATRT